MVWRQVKGGCKKAYTSMSFCYNCVRIKQFVCDKQFLFCLNFCVKVCCPRPRDLLKSSKVTFSCILAFSALNILSPAHGGLTHSKHISCSNWQNSLNLMRFLDNSRTYLPFFLQTVCCSITTGV